MINIDFCRLVCHDERLQGLDDISPIDITVFVQEVDDDDEDDLEVHGPFGVLT